MNKRILFMLCLTGAFGLTLSAQTDTIFIGTDTVVTEMLPIQADRPDQTETPYTVPKGYAQMEFGFSITDTEPGFIYTYPAALWKVGVTNNFELRLITNYVTIQKEPNPDHSGFLPIAAGLKAKLSEQKGIWPKTSFIGHLRVPGVVSEDFETTYIAPDLRLAFQHTVSDLYSLSYNAGLFWDGENPEPLITYSLSNSFSILERLGIFAEVFGSTPQRESDDPELSVDAGLTYLIGNNFLLDVSAGTGLTDNVLESFISAGFSYRFKL